ncbi:YjiH family protein [Alteribacillus iranensis]|uniref:Nucleoside recognition GATE domain-containing membrane protein YjiH n=1 Tax=Alteribacillus iranensis TaxID=930128 RepID=A0A1I1ZW24_9BACI|nr:YjiH family protein [Alteribacillus iranensis]SFE35829.1 nucleoside recognition GATE domain-containing membrane protein YjiH [Alteribacillus iranensis]
MSFKMSTEGSVFRFIIPSLVGVFLFMIPLSINDEITIPVAWLAGWVQGAAGPYLPAIAVLFMFISAIGSFIVKITGSSSKLAMTLFDVSWFWVIIRFVGFVMSALVIFQIGPAAVTSEATGGMLLFDLIPLLITVFLFAGFLLPLLLNFGLLEFCGALLTPIMRPLFTLPGRAAIDSAASWLGDGTIGVLLTNQQYEEGHYSKREAAVIGTTFSVVSITFSIVILAEMDLMSYILPYYFAIVAAGFVAAIIMPRIPPLSRKKDDYYTGDRQSGEQRPSHINAFLWGVRQATMRAATTSFSTLGKGGLKNVLDMWIGVLPIVMAFGTGAVIVAETTPFFSIIGAPFVPILELMQVPEAVSASETMLIGFADMFLPAILGSGIESEMTRFIIAALSVTQLIYMSEVGGLLLASKVPVHLLDLILIFLERTVITLPIITLIAHFVF